MEHCYYDEKAAKATAHLSVNSDLLRQAKMAKVNLSEYFEKSLAAHLRELKLSEWQENSREGIAEYKEFVENNGCFSDSLRSF
jgi:post-segregation antitoxin (ccd killing protein)